MLIKASKILVSLGASVNLTLSHRSERYGHFRSEAREAGSAALAARDADATSPRREIGVGISPQVEPGVSADENTKLSRAAPPSLPIRHERRPTARRQASRQKALG